MTSAESNLPLPHETAPRGGASRLNLALDRRLVQLKRRLVREASMAIGMLESALAALWTLDVEAARGVRRADDRIDSEEVDIERECHEILALQHLFAHDLRMITFVLKVNADLERVADHATSIAKVVGRIAKHRPDGTPPQWPQSLIELGQRVPMLAQRLLRAVLDEDVEAARALVHADQVIDQLDRRVFEESLERMLREGSDEHALAVGILTYRLGRELERIGDLITNIAEDVVYLATGSIIRHAEKRQRPQTNEPGGPPAGG